MTHTPARSLRRPATVAICALLACCGIAASAAAQPEIIAGPFTRNGQSYYLTSLTTWTMAEAKAVSMGGHLVTIESAAENEWLGSTVLPHSPVAPWAWIGLTDEAQEGTWVWVSGSGACFRRWFPGEPNNCSSALGDEDYACFCFGSYWCDYPQNPANPCATPLTTLMPGLIEIPGSAASPQVKYWADADGGDWADDDNWSPAGVPPEETKAAFGIPGGVYAVTLSDVRRTAGVEVLDGSVTFAFGGFGLFAPTTECNAATYSLVTSPEINSASTLTLLSGSLELVHTAMLATGDGSGSTLDIVGESAVLARDAIHAGAGADSTANISVSNAHLTAMALYLGAQHGAHATLSVGDVGVVDLGKLYAGYVSGDSGGPATTGTINLENGGTLDADELILGYRPRTNGGLYLNGGMLRVDSLVISDEGSGMLDWAGGTIESLRSLTIGRGPGSDGQLNLDGAGRSLVLSGAGGVAAITVGDQGRGQLTVQNGADISLSAGQLQGLRIGAHPSARGRVLVDGPESSILGSADASTDSSLLVVGNSYGADGTLVVDNGGVVTFGHVLCGSNIAAPGGGIVVSNHSYLTSRGLGDAFSTPATGLRVGNAEGTAYMHVLLGGVVTANSAIFTGTSGSEPVVTVENADSTLDVKETLYLVDYGTSVVPELKVRGGGLLKTCDAYIGTGMGGASSSGIVTLVGPGIVWESTGTINVGDPTDVNAVGTLNLINNAEVQTHRFHPGATTHITGGATNNPLIQVGSNRAAADITCDTLLIGPGTNLGNYNLTYGPGAGIGGNGTWPGDFAASFGAEIVAAQAVPFPDPWAEYTEFTIAGSLTMDATSTLDVACGYNRFIGGEYSWSINSRLVVQGSAAIDGTLRIQQWDLDDGLHDHWSMREEMIGRTYEVLAASSIVGTFDQLVLAPDFVSNRARLTYEPDSVLITIDPPVCNPAITAQPVGVQTWPGGTMTLTTAATTEFGELEYHWEWLNVQNFNQWEPVVEGTNNTVFSAVMPSPGTIQVTIDPAYSHHGYTLPNELRMRCSVGALKCNEWLQSDEAILLVCAPDADHDGTLDFFDYDAFVVMFETGDPGADFDGDGTIDFFDYDAFVVAFELGC